MAPWMPTPRTTPSTSISTTSRSSLDIKVVTPDTASQTETSSSFTSLRRTTRSQVASKSSPASPSSVKLDLASYAYSPAKGRKRTKIEASSTLQNGTPSTPETSKRSKVKTEPVTPDATERAETPKSSGKKAKTKPFPQLALDKPHPAPARWEEQYRLIERMRRGIVAPVDDMGCERPRTTTEASPKVLRFHILISLMLSSQTKDAITSQAVTNLHQTLPGGLTAESLAEAPQEVVWECINKVGFWRRKTEYIQDAARKLLERQGEEKGDVPDTLEGLCELKGVGPKMAFLALQCAWDINAGIGVDVHVHRITNRLRWHKPQTTTPEQTRLNLQSWLPPELHKPINPMMVGFGQVICLPVGPRCDLCLLGQRKICPSRVSNVKSEGRKEVSYTFTAEDDGDSDGDAKLKIEYEDVKLVADATSEPVKKEEMLHGDETAKAEEMVLEILDRVDGSVDIGAKK